MTISSLDALPKDLLVLLPDFIHNIEDFTNLSSTCTKLRDCMATAKPNTILRLAAAQSRIFFRPSPHFLLTATARELGNWARQSDANEKTFAARATEGVEGLLDLALEHCGLTLDRVRQLYSLRFSIVNPVTEVIDRCVGSAWYSTENFWNGGVSDACTISGDPETSIFHLAIYGELFGPDFETYLDPSNSTSRRLSLETRLEFIKYAVPDYATIDCQNSAWDVNLADGTVDPRRAAQATGPYAPDKDRRQLNQSNLALIWVLQSSRFRPYWKAMRVKAGVEDFVADHKDAWLDDHDDEVEDKWRQRLWESVMVAQGLEGLGMMRPDLQDQWRERVRAWRVKIAAMSDFPDWIKVGRMETLEYPFLMGDLSICSSGYVSGT